MDFTKMTSIFCFVLIFCLTQAGKIPELSPSKEDVMADLDSLSDVSDHQLSHADSNSPPDAESAGAPPPDAEVAGAPPPDPSKETKDARDNAVNNDAITDILSAESNGDDDDGLAAMDKIATVNSETHAADILAEGDMVLTNEQKYKLAYGHDIQSDLIGNTANHWKTYEADPEKKWPKLLIVPYQFYTYNSKVQRAMKAAFKHYKENTCVRFRRRGNERNYINVIRGNGCYSYVGMQSSSQPLSLGNRCEYTGIAVHELMHALGYMHEQSRPDRDQYVNIKWGNIYSWARYNFKKHDTDSQGTTYDFESVMHYGTTAFSANGRKTIERKDGSNNKLGQRKGLSELDKKQINMLYCGAGAITTKGPVTASPTTTTTTTTTTAATTTTADPCLGTCQDCSVAKKCSKCADKRGGCSYWAGRGHCEDNYRYWMSLKCATSCACK